MRSEVLEAFKRKMKRWRSREIEIEKECVCLNETKRASPYYYVGRLSLSLVYILLLYKLHYTISHFRYIYHIII